jgi:hypothetical protein
MRRFYDTTAPTKEGLLRDNKIVSNLQGAKSAAGLSQECGKVKAGTLGIDGIPLYGGAGFKWRNLVSVSSAAVTT